MPDVHLSADVCIGTVVATDGTLYPNAVGGDIGCGVAALAFESAADVLDNERTAAQMLNALYRAIPFVRHNRRSGRCLSRDLAARPLSMPALDGLKATAALQLGTLGSGNHFVEFQEDEAGRLWVMLHSGSRGIGQAIRDHHQARAVGTPAGLRFLRAESSEGQAYLDDLAWALDYADANRRALLDAVKSAVAEVLRVDADDASYTSCHHNHVRREVHGVETLWVHRKGAMPAAAGESGLLPGSMGTRSFHVEGRGHEDALCSSAHGAGRRLSRSDAQRKVSSGDLLKELRDVWFDHRLAGRLREESPAAYKDVEAVLRQQRELVRVVRRLRPVLSFKGV
jgi:tRNA-splicing ligase RtcB (3'-phosphate/5'-hydroxy nucleic acid ligase)